MRIRLTVIAVLAIGLAGCAGEPTPTEAGTLSIAGRDHAEINVALVANGTLRWDWASEGDVAFDVHSHQGAKDVTHATAQGDHHAGGFQAPTNGTYSLFWGNPAGAEATVRYKLWTDGTLLP